MGDAAQAAGKQSRVTRSVLDCTALAVFGLAMMGLNATLAMTGQFRRRPLRE
ncbi:MAG: hypothetical protein IRY89_09990 [Pseudolabrys sp.]|nr:hypothetical protein [Pseudolabrys sp.]